MSVKVMTLVWRRSHCCADPSSLVVLLALADWSNNRGESNPSLKRLASKARQSVRNVQFVLRRLEADGYLVVAPDSKSGRGRTSTYRLNLQKLKAIKPRDMGENFSPIASDNKDSGMGENSAPLSDSMGEKFSPIPELMPEQPLLIKG